MQICRISLFQISNLRSAPSISKHKMKNVKTEVYWSSTFSTRIIFHFMLFLFAEASEALLSRSLMIWQNKTMFWYRGRWTQIGYLKKWNSAYLHKCILINVIKWCLSKIWVPNQCKTLCYTDFPRTRNPEPRMGKWRGLNLDFRDLTLQFIDVGD